MNQLPMFEGEIYITESDVANQVYRDCVSIPSSTFLKAAELETIVCAIKNHFHSLT